MIRGLRRTIGGLFALSLLLAAIASTHHRPADAPAEPEWKTALPAAETLVDRQILAAAHRTMAAAMAAVGPALDRAYAPAVAAARSHARAHYSVLTANAETARGALAAWGHAGALPVERRVLAGLQPRLDAVAAALDRTMAETYVGTLQGVVTDVLLMDGSDTPLPAPGTARLGDTLVEAIRFRTMNGLLATLALSSALGWALVRMARGRLIAAGWGVLAGTCAWVAADQTVLGVRALMEREALETRLVAAVTDHRVATESLLRQAIAAKAAGMAAVTIRDVFDENG